MLGHWQQPVSRIGSQQQQRQQQQPLLPRLTTLHASSLALQLLLAWPGIALPSLTDLRCAAAELQGPSVPYVPFADLLRRLPQLDSLTLLPSASPWVSQTPARLCRRRAKLPRPALSAGMPRGARCRRAARTPRPRARHRDRG